MKRYIVVLAALLTAVASAQDGTGLSGDSDDPAAFSYVFASEYDRLSGPSVFGMRTAFEALVDLDAPNVAAGRMEAGGAFLMDGFSVFTDLELVGDGRYAAVASQDYLGGVWSRITRAGFSWTSDSLSITAGRMPHFDEVETPYSQFVNSNGHPADLIDIKVDIGRFYYQTRWICLSLNQDTTPDRGTVYKVLGARFSHFSFGIQDASVFVRPGAFDVAYFLIPWSGFITQHVDTTSDAPWERDVNDNSIMGLFCEYNEGEIFAYGQVLIDDINLNRFFNPDGRMIPDKIGFALGGRIDTAYGKYALHLGGATKYTFESYGNESVDEQYGYSYDYASSYELGGAIVPLFPEENAVGFKYGENSLAIQIAFAGTYPWLDLDASLEYVVNGERSPANPWHDLPRAPDETEFLNDALLEHRIFATVHVSKDLGWCGIYAGFQAGWHANPSGLRPTDEDDIDEQPYHILSPERGGRPIFSLSIGVKSALSMTGAN